MAKKGSLCTTATRRNILANTCHLLPLFLPPPDAQVMLPALFLWNVTVPPISDALCSRSLAYPTLYLLVCGNEDIEGGRSLLISTASWVIRGLVL